MKSLLDLIPKRRGKEPLSFDAVAMQLEAARQDLAQAETAYGTAALAALDDPAINLDQAEQAVTDARRKVELLDAALSAAHAREEKARRDAIAKAQDAEDAEVRKACAHVLKLAPTVTEPVAAFVAALAPLVEAYAHARRLAYANPRARRDVAAALPSLDTLLADELARLAPEGVRVPGQNPTLRLTKPADQIKPLAEVVADLFFILMPAKVHHG
jgi:hypothetical protein